MLPPHVKLSRAAAEEEEELGTRRGGSAGEHSFERTREEKCTNATRGKLFHICPRARGSRFDDGAGGEPLPFVRRHERNSDPRPVFRYSLAALLFYNRPLNVHILCSAAVLRTSGIRRRGEWKGTNDDGAGMSLPA